MKRNFQQFYAALVTLIGVLCLPGRAAAFCQATTCDPTLERCGLSGEGCLTKGKPLSWVSSCITVSVQASGSPVQHVDYAAAQASVTRAFAAWTGARCAGDQLPSIAVQVEGPVQCDASEYNADRANANIVMFREDSWPYPGAEDALGLTRIRFDPTTGEIWDSDIEVNAVDEPLSVGEAMPGFVDLDSLLTHEAGHLLGLAHNTRDTSATMFPGYAAGSVALRSLEIDDVSGICSVYPPTRTARTTSCEPRHGFSELCGAVQPPPAAEASVSETSGCAISRSAASEWPGLAGWIVAMVALSSRARRRSCKARLI